MAAPTLQPDLAAKPSTREKADEGDELALGAAQLEGSHEEMDRVGYATLVRSGCVPACKQAVGEGVERFAAADNAGGDPLERADRRRGLLGFGPRV